MQDYSERSDFVEQGFLDLGAVTYEWAILERLTSFRYEAILYWDRGKITSDLCSTRWGARWTMRRAARRHHRRLQQRLDRLQGGH